MLEFDNAVLLPDEYSFWTAAYYEHATDTWLWGPNDPVDKTLFCDWYYFTVYSTHREWNILTVSP